MAARALAALPVLAVAGWSSNAAYQRLQLQSNQSTLEFRTGSMDETVMETLNTGDLVLFRRRLTSLQPLAALYTWAIRRAYNPRFDQCGIIYEDSLGRKFVAEETLSQVHSRPYSARVLTSASDEIVILPLKTERSQEFNKKIKEYIDTHVDRPSRVSGRHLLHALVDCVRPPRTGTSPIDQNKLSPLMPCAGFVAEAYETIGLLPSSPSITPREFFRQPLDASAKFGRQLPIRLL